MPHSLHCTDLAYPLVDQIVRTDLKELVDLNLEGHVYGYAPMGDDRKDMEGFRFWKTGKTIIPLSITRLTLISSSKVIGTTVFMAALIISGETTFGAIIEIG